MMKAHFTLLEVSQITGLSISSMKAWIDKEWVTPQATQVLDHEDMARLLLIHELQVDLGANEEAIPIILHLLDQLYYVQNRLHNGVSK